MTSTLSYPSLGLATPHYPHDALERRKQYMRDVVDGGFPYSRKLSAHTACVNAITFSNGDGRWLASAGDDPFIYLWDFHQTDLSQPTCGYIGHSSNVFALAFSATNSYLYSGDTDDLIFKYDVSQWSSYSDEPGNAVTTLNRHEDSIRDLSCHPENDNLLLSAGDDGRILLHDLRAGDGTRPEGRLFGGPSFTSVQHHPTMHNLFVTGDSLGEVVLRDVRMAFDSFTLHKKGVVQEYVTGLSKRPHVHLSRAEVGSICFDRTGSKLAVTLLHYLPTVFAVMDPFPLAVLSGTNLPDGTPISSGERTYTNSCTIKHGSFGGPSLDGDEYYSAGSDDFRAYVWKIPSTESLQEARETISSEEWHSGERPITTVGFAPTIQSDRSLPLELSTPSCRLAGHKSIVNSTVMHPHWPFLVTAGVERYMLLHSPLPSGPCFTEMSLTSQDARLLPAANEEDRRRFVQALTSGRRIDEEDNDDDDTIALFDEILRQEGHADVFVLRSWSPELDFEEEEFNSLDDPGDTVHVRIHRDWF
ncbi:hypothetical protein QCA50_006803 [Cerrena zonata]|uniref:WD40 repeat-like protein n=1 Tax=Cerrena zonata TaxID=2478898 RepID=A0AAW0GG10_9APHY